MSPAPVQDPTKPKKRAARVSLTLTTQTHGIEEKLNCRARRPNRVESRTLVMYSDTKMAQKSSAALFMQAIGLGSSRVTRYVAELPVCWMFSPGMQNTWYWVPPLMDACLCEGDAGVAIVEAPRLVEGGRHEVVGQRVHRHRCHLRAHI